MTTKIAHENGTRYDSRIRDTINKVYPKAGSAFIEDLVRIATTEVVENIRGSLEIPEMRLAIALNPNTPPDVLLKILKENRNPEIAKTIVSHPNMREDGFLFLIENEKNIEVIVAAISNSKAPIPRRFLDACISIQDSDVQRALVMRFLKDLRNE